MRVIKYSTENLVCYFRNGKYYMYEKQDTSNPIAILPSPHTLHISEKIPNPENKYKYFREMQEILYFLINKCS